jgi:hypothetical protein
MPLVLAGFTFEGPFAFYSDIKDEAGVYVILDDRLVDQRIIDIGEAENIRSRINFHEREGCWKNMCLGTLGIGTLYLPRSTAQQRLLIEDAIRKEHKQIACAPA